MRLLRPRVLRAQERCRAACPAARRVRIWRLGNGIAGKRVDICDAGRSSRRRDALSRESHGDLGQCAVEATGQKPDG